MGDLLHLGELLQQAAADWLRHSRCAGCRNASTTPRGPARWRSCAWRAIQLVHIVTIHKSKGCSIGGLPALPRPDPGAERSPSAPASDDAGALCLDLGSDRGPGHPRGPASSGRTSPRRCGCSRGPDRASHRCYLTWGRYTDAGAPPGSATCYSPGRTRTPGRPLGFPETDAALRAPWGQPGRGAARPCTVAELPAPAGRGPGRAGPGRRRRGRALALTRTVRQGWRLSSYTGLLTSHAGQLIEQPDHDAMEDATATVPSHRPERRSSVSPGARAGAFLHRVLESPDFTEPSFLALVRRLLPAYGFDGGWAETIAAHLEGVLAQPLDDAGIRLAGFGRRAAHRRAGVLLPRR
ncbi:MAG: hypothetical protein U5L11_14105 [Arhodomonas sp.]|nr:hypothetical protein [Arhodomonas sp.]